MQASKLTDVGKLPFLEINGYKIQDSRKIIEYLEKHFPEHSLKINVHNLDSEAHLLEDWLTSHFIGTKSISVLSTKTLTNLR